MASSPYFILNDGNDITQVGLSIRLNVPFRASAFIKAETAMGLFNSVEIEVVVCGLELLSAKAISKDDLTFSVILGNSFKLNQTTIENYFTMSYDEDNCHSSCSYIDSIQILEAQTCLYTKSTTKMARFSL